MAQFKDKLKHAWNAFTNDETTNVRSYDYGANYSVRGDRTRMHSTNERSIISSIYTRLSIDVAASDIQHVRLDSDNRFLEPMDSGLNNCLTLEANIDQGARAFKQDIVMTLLDKGAIAIVPVDTSLDPTISDSFDIKTLRVAEITQWYPRHVRVNVYDDTTGLKKELVLPKATVAIVENPFYAVMNEPNSTLQRLIRKLSLLDQLDEKSSSGKLDMLIQLPYVIKSEQKRAQAEMRRNDIEVQLTGSKYGIAYIDGTEKITQLNRPVENNLLAQVEYLTTMLYGQLGLTPEIFTGKADEATMLNYHNRTIEPILAAIIQAMKRSFLTKTGRTQKQSIEFFRDPFKLVAVSDLAEIADKFTRNEILSSNEVRGIIGMRPAKDKSADELRNKNLPVAEDLGELSPIRKAIQPLTPQPQEGGLQNES